MITAGFPSSSVLSILLGRLDERSDLPGAQNEVLSFVASEVGLEDMPVTAVGRVTPSVEEVISLFQANTFFVYLDQWPQLTVRDLSSVRGADFQLVWIHLALSFLCLFVCLFFVGSFFLPKQPLNLARSYTFFGFSTSIGAGSTSRYFSIESSIATNKPAKLSSRWTRTILQGVVCPSQGRRRSFRGK